MVNSKRCGSDDKGWEPIPLGAPDNTAQDERSGIVCGMVSDPFDSENSDEVVGAQRTLKPAAIDQDSHRPYISCSCVPENNANSNSEVG